MSEPNPPSTGSLAWESNRQVEPDRFWIILGIILIFLACFAIWGNTHRRADGRYNVIVNNLRILESAVAQWAYQHGGTNANVAKKEDILPYLKHWPDAGPDGWIKPVMGERYAINAHTGRPEAQLTRNFGSLLKGTIIRMDTNAAREEIILPDNPH